MPNSGSVNDTLEGRVFETVEKALKRVDRTVHLFAFRFGGREYEIELLVGHFGVRAAATVYQGFHLCRHGVEIDGGTHDYRVGGEHFVDDFRGVVFLRARLAVEAAYAASGAVVDVFVGEEDLFDVVTCLNGAAHEFVA